jgi:hypothetical protein
MQMAITRLQRELDKLTDSGYRNWLERDLVKSVLLISFDIEYPSAGAIVGSGLIALEGGPILGRGLKIVGGYRERVKAGFAGDFETAGVSADEAWERRAMPRLRRGWK